MIWRESGARGVWLMIIKAGDRDEDTAAACLELC